MLPGWLQGAAAAEAGARQRLAMRTEAPMDRAVARPAAAGRRQAARGMTPAARLLPAIGRTAPTRRAAASVHPDLGE
jgi:hypothetical protein